MCQCGFKYASCGGQLGLQATHNPNKVLEVDGLVAVDVDLDVTANDVGHDLPLEAGREGLGLGLGRKAPAVLALLELCTLGVCATEVVGGVHASVSVH